MKRNVVILSKGTYIKETPDEIKRIRFLKEPHFLAYLSMCSYFIAGKNVRSAKTKEYDKFVLGEFVDGFDEILSSNNYSCLFAFDKESMDFLGCVVAYHDLLCVNEARITMLYVETKYRNQGIATELLNNVKDIVKERSCGDRKFDCIEVLNFNYNTHMKNLLIKNGYHKVKEFGELKTLYKLELRGEKK